MIKTEYIILGAGIAGLSAAYHLKNKGISAIVLEKDATYGGLCSNFEINGFRFDRFVHLSFSDNEYVNKVFVNSTDFIIHHPNPYNIYRKIWIKHPAQNNLYPLSKTEKEHIIEDFKQRPKVDIAEIKNYEQWLRIQYGDYFAEHFPLVYTRKYWMHEASDLETKWIGNRLYQPSIEEVIKGCETPDTPITYYAKEMRYPVKGGYKSFLNNIVKDLSIYYENNVDKIDTRNKKVISSKGIYSYDRLISSLPLPYLINILDNVPSEVKDASDKLKVTCGYLVSIALKTTNIPPYLWWYIYDEDILAARVYSPSLKSANNVPLGCSSLQMEVYCNEDEFSKEELYARTVKKLIDLDIIKEEDIQFVDIRFEPFANVVFDHNIYVNRKVVKDYLKSVGINVIGRFGEWEYFWSDQSFLSGKNIVEEICS